MDAELGAGQRVENRRGGVAEDLEGLASAAADASVSGGRLRIEHLSICSDVSISRNDVRLKADATTGLEGLEDLVVIGLVSRVLEDLRVADHPSLSMTKVARLAMPFSPIMSGLNTP